PSYSPWAGSLRAAFEGSQSFRRIWRMRERMLSTSPAIMVLGGLGRLLRPICADPFPELSKCRHVTGDGPAIEKFLKDRGRQRRKTATSIRPSVLPVGFE